MKILAIIRLAPGADPARVRAELVSELQGSWALYAGGILREAYATDDPTQVVFILEADGKAEAERRLAALPLVQAGLFRLECVELRPFANWSLLFAH